MRDELFENTKVASYFLWEHTRADNALALWTCAEDIADYLECCGIFDSGQIYGVLMKGVYSTEYIALVKNIAYRIFIYTGREDAEENWFTAERLIRSGEWRGAVAQIAIILNGSRHDAGALSGVRSEKVRRSHLYDPSFQTR